MDDTTFFNWFGLGAIIIIAFYFIILSINKDRLKDKGIETKGYILRWHPLKLDQTYTSEVQSISVPTIRFTTNDGKEITGQPITGVCDSPDYINVWIKIIYNPNNPEEFMIKE